MTAPLRKAAGVAAVVGALALVLSGCTGSPSSNSSGSPAAKDTAITIAQVGEPAASQTDPCDDENAGTFMHNNVVQALTDLDPKSGNVIPLLSTSWKQTDPTTWTFTLRKGVKFQDGTPFNAAAAVYGINRDLNNTKIACSDTAKLSSGVKVTPTAIDATTLQLKTNVPDPILPREMAYMDIVSTKIPADQQTVKPVGTGPFTWDSWVSGQYYLLKAWSGYWGKKPQASSVKVIFRPDATVRANSVTTGEADMAMGILPQNAQSGANYKAVTFPLGSTVFYRLSLQTPPLNDIRVRQAVQYALNKKQITKSLMQGIGTPTGQMIVSSVAGYDPDYKAPAYNLAKAKSLLADAKAAGVPVDTQITLVGQTNQFTNSDEVVQGVLSNLQAAGLNVKLQTVDAAQWKTLLFKPFPADQAPMILQTFHKNVSGDAASSFSSYLASSSCCGTAKDPTIDSLLSKGLQQSGDEREATFRKISDEEYTKDISVVPLAEVSAIMLISNRISYQPNVLTQTNELLLSDIKVTGK
jgi:peptide/nickel transport system substrate-binding protein